MRIPTIGRVLVGASVMVLAQLVAISQAPPAAAVTVNADDATADKTATINGIPMKVRVLRPTTGGPYPLVVYLTKSGSRCDNVNGSTTWLTRKYLAEQGYVVVSLNARGKPGSKDALLCPNGSQSTWNADVKDGLDDSGFDAAGPVDVKDVTDVITWALAGCATACTNIETSNDSSDIAVLGEGPEATRALLVARADSRVDAVIPVGFKEVVRNIASLSSDGAGTSRPVDLGYQGLRWGENQGYFGHADPSVMTSWASILRTSFLPSRNYTASVSSSTRVLTVTGPPYFSNADVGRTISVAGAGASGGLLWTTIQTYTSPTQVTLTAVNTTVSASNPRLASWQPQLGNRNPTGGTTNGSTTVTISSTSSPKFTSGDVGKPITVAGGLSGGGTLSASIATVATNGESVTVTGAGATATTANAQVRWGPAAWFDQRTIVDDDNAVDKAHLLTTQKVFFVAGFVDGEAGTLSSIEAWQKVKAVNSEAYLYLGDCGAYPAPCGSTNRGWLQTKVIAFIDKHLKGAGGSLGGPVFYLVPSKSSGSAPPLADGTWVPSDTWTTGGVPSEATTWPPAASGTYTYCLGSNEAWSSGAADGNCAPPVGGTSTRSIALRNDITVSGTNVTDAWRAFCLCQLHYPIGYAASGTPEVVKYDLPTSEGNDARMIRFEADVRVHSTTSRQQVYLDLYEVRGTTEIPIWHGSARTVPTARHQLSNGSNLLRFKFQPSGSAWTFDAGSTLRLKIATNNRNLFASELVTGTTTVVHGSTTPFKFAITWA